MEVSGSDMSGEGGEVAVVVPSIFPTLLCRVRNFPSFKKRGIAKQDLDRSS